MTTEQELDELFALANAELKESEILGGATVVSALNEFRYANEHRIRAQQAETEEQKHSELAKAKGHYIRAAYDALESRVLFSLERFKNFQENFSKLAEKEDMPAYMEAINYSKELQQFLLAASRSGQKPELFELKEKAQQLDRQLEKLSENRKVLIKSIEKSKNKARSHVISSVFGLVTSIVAAFFSMYLFQGTPSKDVDAQIKNLGAIQKSLSDLQSYVTDQRSSLQNLNKDISSLKKEKAELEQVVALENNKIKLVLSQYDKSQKERRWLDILISFFVGVFSSTTATFLLSYRRKSREAPSVDMLVNTKGEKI